MYMRYQSKDSCWFTTIVEALRCFDMFLYNLLDNIFTVIYNYYFTFFLVQEILLLIVISKI